MVVFFLLRRLLSRIIRDGRDFTIGMRTPNLLMILFLSNEEENWKS